MSSKRNSVIKVFLIRATLIYIGWLFLYHYLIIPDGRLNMFLTNQVIKGTVTLLDVFGYEQGYEGNTVYIDNQPVVLVADECNGLELFALYIGFILAFPGRILYKLIFIPSGIVVIYCINILREFALSLNYKFFQETFEVNHKYTYVFIVYLVVFIIWRYWLKNFSILAKPQSD